ncbi:ABC transporter transmembrane domain-containing protein [Methylogaea oryzae]|uniref:ABC transporter transmembrane domain-containing protein n=1 Tax=Methylogaea oryzae TaxID=1295382 RepID=UPI000AFA393C|nr:ABC transporter ATP-binding protein [Methylogaea oryzae]
MTDTPPRFDWPYFRRIAAEHKGQMVAGHIIAVLAALASVPVPLLMPLLVDEVLLHKPGITVATVNKLAPVEWHGPLLYIGALLLLTLLLRAVSTLLNVWQVRQFALISKDAIYRMRVTLLQHLQRVSMAEYESLGGGAVAARLVTDLDNIDKFLGDTLGRLLVSVLTIAGTAVVLLWMHWQLGLFILLLNPLVIYFTQAMGKRVKQLKKSENSAIERSNWPSPKPWTPYSRCAPATGRPSTWDAGGQGRRSARALGRFRLEKRRRQPLELRGVPVRLRRVPRLRHADGVLFRSEHGRDAGRVRLPVFMMSPVQEVLNIQYAFFAARAALGRVNQLAALQQEPHYPHLANPFQGKRTVGIRVENLHFAYPNGHSVLNGVSLDIRPGEKIAWWAPAAAASPPWCRC